MSFALFLVLNAILLLRPEELYPELAGARLYLITISLCLLTALPRLLSRLTPDALRAQPVTVCVLGFWAAGILSQLVRGQFGLAMDFAGEFGKVILYYLLLVGVVNTAGRLRAFLGWIVIFVAVMAALGLLQYHGVIDNEALQPLERLEFGQEGEDPTIFVQLRATGIFNDPNDLCLILVTGSICALYRTMTAASLFRRLAWLAPIGLFAYAVLLTQSRGGLLGVGAAGLTWAYGYFGWRKTLIFALILLPAVPLLLGGRQADMSLGQGGTAHERFQLWSDGLVALTRNPITGIGVGEFAEEMGLVAHNSFVHAYVETGLCGGTCFLSAFSLSILGIYRTNTVPDRLLMGLRTATLAIAVGYATCVFSLSRDYVVPTYLVLGLATGYVGAASADQSHHRFHLNSRMLGGVALLGIAGLASLKVLTQLLLSLS